MTYSPPEGEYCMTQTTTGPSQRVLLVDDDDLTLELTTLQLVKNGFEVVAAPSVTTALKLIATETFNVLVTDLNMPNAADGFTVVTAMRHSHPQALILLVSGNPDVNRAMATIALQPDEILVKPLECQKLPELIRERMLSRKPVPRVHKERVGIVLNRCQPAILENWLTRAKSSPDLIYVNLSDDERTGHLPGMLDGIVARLARNHLHLWRRMRSFPVQPPTMEECAASRAILPRCSCMNRESSKLHSLKPCRKTWIIWISACSCPMS